MRPRPGQDSVRPEHQHCRCTEHRHTTKEVASVSDGVSLTSCAPARAGRRGGSAGANSALPRSRRTGFGAAGPAETLSVGAAEARPRHGGRRGGGGWGGCSTPWSFWKQRQPWPPGRSPAPSAALPTRKKQIMAQKSAGESGVADSRRPGSRSGLRARPDALSATTAWKLTPSGRGRRARWQFGPSVSELQIRRGGAP